MRMSTQGSREQWLGDKWMEMETVGKNDDREDDDEGYQGKEDRDEDENGGENGKDNGRQHQHPQPLL